MSGIEVQNIIITYLKDYNPVKVAIFGSFARDENTPSSDIDILVQFRQTYSLLQLINIENTLSEKLGIKVDLVTEGAIKNDRIKKSIQKDLQIIYQA
ncbi:MAG: nucleotidyltransferase family protein [Bacteroidales bacterium]|nr:nucleotidyltransferase family protein [Bacteroidales bacterium]